MLPVGAAFHEIQTEAEDSITPLSLLYELEAKWSEVALHRTLKYCRGHAVAPALGETSTSIETRFSPLRRQWRLVPRLGARICGQTQHRRHAPHQLQMSHGSSLLDWLKDDSSSAGLLLADGQQMAPRAEVKGASGRGGGGKARLT